MSWIQTLLGVMEGGEAHRLFVLKRAGWRRRSVPPLSRMPGRRPWRQGGDGVGRAIQNVARELGDWGRNVLGRLEKSIKKQGRRSKTRKALEERRRVVSGESVHMEEILKFKLQKLEEKKNLYWHQRAKVHWLDKGDRSTRFFHQYASKRKQRSRINRLATEGGVVVEEEGAIKNVISNFYKNLFSATAGSRMEELMLQMSPKVSVEMNDSLLRPFTTKEVRSGLDAIGDLNAPAADGMTSLFYKKYSETVGEDITREVLLFFNGGVLPRAWMNCCVVDPKGA
jgi:hypothetical protein